ncbi:MAG: hypothetical protein ACK5CA_18225 [Cyanobacteriota bacterium]|jgi:hypothetical protein
MLSFVTDGGAGAGFRYSGLCWFLALAMAEPVIQVRDLGKRYSDPLGGAPSFILSFGRLKTSFNFYQF